MLRLLKLSIFAGTFFILSCEECTRCSCTYDVTTIEQTINGEVEVVESKTTYATKEGDSTFFVEECIKGDEVYTIKDLYDLEQQTSILDNMNCTCIDF